MPKKPKIKAKPRKPRFPHLVCKPCWELKYCPYGPLIEYFPLVSDDLSMTKIKKSYKSWMDAIKSGELKTETEIYEAIRKILCLEPRRLEFISRFRTDELSCSIFGHICPVYFTAEPITETKDSRRIGRTIPRDVMLKVVRRDGQMCRVCGINVPDNEVEFDHIIPHVRGGPSTSENIRLLCRECNRAKSASLKEILKSDE